MPATKPALTAQHVLNWRDDARSEDGGWHPLQAADGCGQEWNPGNGSCNLVSGLRVFVTRERELVVLCPKWLLVSLVAPLLASCSATPVAGTTLADTPLLATATVESRGPSSASASATDMPVKQSVTADATPGVSLAQPVPLTVSPQSGPPGTVVSLAGRQCLQDAETRGIWIDSAHEVRHSRPAGFFTVHGAADGTALASYTIPVTAALGHGQLYFQCAGDAGSPAGYFTVTLPPGVAPCDATNLAASTSATVLTINSWSKRFDLRNTSAKACVLAGTPTVEQLLTAVSARVDLVVKASTSAPYEPVGTDGGDEITDDPIVVRPGSTAYFYLAGTRPPTDSGCSDVWHTLAVHFGNGTRTVSTGVPSCRGTTASVSPFTFL